MSETTSHSERFWQGELHVVKVLNAREMVVSGGAEANLEVDMILRVLGNEVDLEDPLTGEALGQLKTTKLLVRIYDVAPKYALARTFRTRRVNVGGRGIGGTGLDLFSPPKYETRTETLERDSSFDVKGESAVSPGDQLEIWDGGADDVPSVTAWR